MLLTVQDPYLFRSSDQVLEQTPWLMSGGGTLSNTNAFVLNNASSKLLLELNHGWHSVSTSLASLGLDVDANSTVTSLTVGHTTPVSIASMV